MADYSNILLNVANSMDAMQTAQEEMLRTQQALVNHRTETNPHGLSNPNSETYKNLKNIVKRIIEELIEEGSIQIRKI